MGIQPSFVVLFTLCVLLLFLVSILFLCWFNVSRCMCLQEWVTSVCAFRNGSLLYVPLGMGHFCMYLQEWVTSVCAFRNGSPLYVPSEVGHFCMCLQEWVTSFCMCLQEWVTSVCAFRNGRNGSPLSVAFPPPCSNLCFLILFFY